MYFEKVSVSSGGAGPLILVDKSNGTPGKFWDFAPVKGEPDVYYIKYIGWHRDTATNYALVPNLNSNGDSSVGVGVFSDGDINQKWKIL